MAHNVKCPGCNKQFDRDKEDTVSVGRRYYHITCYKEKFKSDPPEEKIVKRVPGDENLAALRQYIDDLWDKQANYPLIGTQLKRYTSSSYKYTYKGILWALQYYYDVTRHDIDPRYKDLSIIPYYYTKAKAYFERIENAQKINEDKQIEDYEQKEVQVIHIPTPQTTVKRRKLFTFFDEEE